MKFDRDKTKILFLSPFNQIYFQLFVEKSAALLINVKKKKYWEGDFKNLIEEMWNIDLDLDELKMLIMKGIVPERKISQSGMKFTMKDDKKTKKPKSIKIQQGEILLQLIIQKRKIKNGKIELYVNFNRYKKSSMRKVLSND